MATFWTSPASFCDCLRVGPVIIRVGRLKRSRLGESFLDDNFLTEECIVGMVAGVQFDAIRSDEMIKHAIVLDLNAIQQEAVPELSVFAYLAVFFRALLVDDYIRLNSGLHGQPDVAMPVDVVPTKRVKLLADSDPNVPAVVVVPGAVGR